MALPPFMYEPLVSPRLFGALDPTQGLTGGGPAYTTIMPSFMPEPAEGPAPVAMTPQEEFLARVQQIEQMVPGVLPAASPSIMPSPSAPPMMSAPSSDVPGFTPTLLDQAASAPEAEYLNPFDAEAYESNAAPLSQSGRVQEANMPVAGAKPEYTAGGALVFNTGRGAMGGFAVPIPGATYALIDNKTGKVITSGTGQAGLEQVWQAANDRSADMGKKANWSVVGVDPTNGREFSVAKDTPPASALGVAADFVLPVLGSVVAGPLGAAAGSGLSSVAQGRSLEDTLLRAAISGGASFAGGELLGGVPTSAGEVAGQVAGQTAGQAAGKVAGQAIIDAAGNMILPVGGSLLGSAAASAVGAGAGSLLGSAIGSAPAPTAPEPVQQPVRVTPEGEMILTAPATAPAVPASNYVLNTLLPAIGAANVTPTSPTTPAEGEIVVQTNRTPPAAPASNYALGTLLPAIGAAAVPSAPLISSTATQPQPAEKNSLLDEIIKYYSLGSGVLDALGGAFGGGGTAVPYTSRLGATPAFTRGAFAPFAGDYETYGFGPEFNFFGGAPTPTPTAPAMGILPPQAQPGPRLA